MKYFWPTIGEIVVIVIVIINIIDADKISMRDSYYYILFAVIGFTMIGLIEEIVEELKEINKKLP